MSGNTMPLDRTQENFNKLPALLCRAEFLHWSGLSGDELSEMVRAQRVAVYRREAGGYGKYFKADLARICHFRV